MTSFHEFSDNLLENKIWKLVPGFLRKKSQRDKLDKFHEVTKEDLTATAISDEESVHLTDRESKDVNNDPPQQSQTAKSTRKLESRQSFTTGLNDRSHIMQNFAMRPLQRGESFNGTLSKNEARRRLESWRRTTIVRKNSEQCVVKS